MVKPGPGRPGEKSEVNVVLEKNTKDKIFKAALKEFSTYGFSGARMDRIARGAKINKALIFYYFSSKETLYRLIMREVFSEVYPRMMGLVASRPTAAEFLEKAPAIYIDMFTRKPEFVKMIALELIQDPGNITAFIRGLFEEKGLAGGVGPEALKGMIRGWYEAGMISEPDPFHFMLNIVSLSLLCFLGKTFLEGFFQESVAMEDFGPKRLESVVNLLKRGMLI